MFSRKCLVSLRFAIALCAALSVVGCPIGSIVFAAVDSNSVNSSVDAFKRQSSDDIDGQERDIVNNSFDFCDPGAVNAQQKALWHKLYLRHKQEQEKAHPPVSQVANRLVLEAANRTSEALADEGYSIGDLPYMPEYRDAVKHADVAAQESLLRKMTPVAQAQAAHERKDFITELKILTPLADSGDLQAQIRVAALYASGQTEDDEIITLPVPKLQVDKNKALALKYYRMAAAGGDARSQENLANAYACGSLGARKDLVKAYAWFSLAVSRSAASLETDERPEEILRKRDFIANKMSHEDAQRAKHLLVRCFKSGYKSCD